jgi:hypothetical protein
MFVVLVVREVTESVHQVVVFSPAIAKQGTEYEPLQEFS